MSQASASDRIRELARGIEHEFDKSRRVLSFSEWFEIFCQSPTLHARSAAQYVRDAMLYFGTEEVRTPGGLVRRFRIFDAYVQEGRARSPEIQESDLPGHAISGRRLVGQERAQNMIFESLEGFCRLGRVDKLLLLHGPNGSAKSTLLECLQRGLEVYSTTEEGALYRFAWIFPNENPTGSGIGFGAGRAKDRLGSESFAALQGKDVDARVVDEFKDHPLFLLPQLDRERLLYEVLGGEKEFVVSETIARGQLSARNYRIFEALLAVHKGDLQKVLAHVQVERFFMSRNYRLGLVDVEPKQAVDARSFPVTGDRAFASLPASVGGQVLYGAQGDLVEANRGLIAFSDLLKRNYEHYKYLLTAVEGRRVALDHITLNLDVVFTGSANDIDLLAFREQNPIEYQSFQARLDRIKVPYLLDYRVERKIYSEQVGDLLRGVHIAPHVCRILALWGVMTRMRRPNSNEYPDCIAEVLRKLTPLDKADLFAYGRVPEGLTGEEARELLAAVPHMYEEQFEHAFIRIDGRRVDDYEGSFGASVRDLKNILLDAASSPDVTSVTVPSIFEYLRGYLRDKSNHRWMDLAADSTFHLLDGDERSATESAWERWLDLSEREVRKALGLVDEERYLELFRKYVTHARHFTRKEKLFDEVTGSVTAADESFMGEIERSIDPTGYEVTKDNEEARRKFREEVIARIGAWALSNPNQEPALEEIFADYFSRMREDYYRQQKSTVSDGVQMMLEMLTDHEPVSRDEALNAEVRDRARQAIDALTSTEDVTASSEFHTEETLKEMLVALTKYRF